MAAAVLLVHGKEALEGEPARGLAGGRQGSHQGAWTRDGRHRHPMGGAQGDQLLPGVGDGGHPGVGHQGAALPRQQALQNGRAAGLCIVAVIGDHLLFQAQVVQQLHRHPGVLRGNKIRLLQRLRHPL